MSTVEQTTDRPAKRASRLYRSAIAAASLVLGAALAIGGVAAPAQAYDEDVIVSLANDARAANGLGGLVHNPSLDAVALDWAQQLAVNGTLSHNPSVGSQIPAGWTRWGENVAQGYNTGASVHEGWMNSSGHRANILGDFTDIGTALIEGGGTTWAVQVFAKYPGSGLPAQPAPPATTTPDPPVSDPPAEEQPAEDPPATDPPATDPPVTNPPTADPPAEEPPAADAPSEEPAAPGGDRPATPDGDESPDPTDGSQPFPWGEASAASFAAMFSIWTIFRHLRW